MLDIAAAAGTETPDRASELVAILEDYSAPLLLLITKSDDRCKRLVGHLTNQLVSSIGLTANANAIRFTLTSRAYSHELAAQSYPRRDGPALHLITAPASPCTRIMEVAGCETFLAWNSEGRVRFAWSTPTVFDPDKPLIRETDFEHALDSVLPFVIFLRSVFAEACWHNPERTAGFVIDDPLLTPKYGFIDFPRLLDSARKGAYHVTLAFIPWNSWRTRARNAKLFRQYSDVFRLCVHGCDHNNNEYGSSNSDLLLHKNHIALERMARHDRRTGLCCAPLMVCPQEQCSLEAWQAFAATPGLLGMVNTGCLPRNVSNTTVRGKDLLLPAHDALFGFPVFKRHYAGNMAPFALALFLGRPAILVEHHDYFRKGPAGIEAFAEDLRRICPTVRWPSLHDVATTTHLRRRESDTSTAVRFFTNRFRFDSASDSARVFCLRKRIHDRAAVRRVVVDGIEVPFSFESEYVTFDVAPPRPRVHEIEIQIASAPYRKVYSCGFHYQSGVAVRRILSETRDNFLSRHKRSATLAKSLVEALHLTGRTARRRKGVPPPAGQ